MSNQEAKSGGNEENEEALRAQSRRRETKGARLRRRPLQRLWSRKAIGRGQGGRDGSGNEDTRPDDGSGYADADCGAEGCAGAVSAADLGGGLRSERDRAGD